MHNRIICIDGAPGDEGGELLALLLVERSIAVDERPLLVVSESTPSNLSSRYQEYADLIQVPVERGLSRFSLRTFRRVLAEPLGRDVIIHLSDAHREAVTERLYRHVEHLAENWDLTWVGAWVLGPSEASHDYLEVYWEAGLGSEIDECVAVLNLDYGDHHDFFWWHAHLRRDGWIPSGEGEEMLQPINTRTLQALLHTTGPLMHSVGGSATNQRRAREALRRWYDDNDRLLRRLTVGPQ